jgi:hypothetical protein
MDRNCRSRFADGRIGETQQPIPRPEKPHGGFNTHHKCSTFSTDPFHDKSLAIYNTTPKSLHHWGFMPLIFTSHISALRVDTYDAHFRA